VSRAASSSRRWPPTGPTTRPASSCFDVHHSADDTLDKVDREGLRTNVATVAALLDTLAESETPVERIPEADRPGRKR